MSDVTAEQLEEHEFLFGAPPEFGTAQTGLYVRAAKNHYFIQYYGPEAQTGWLSLGSALDALNQQGAKHLDQVAQQERAQELINQRDEEAQALAELEAYSPFDWAQGFWNAAMDKHYDEDEGGSDYQALIEDAARIVEYLINETREDDVQLYDALLFIMAMIENLSEYADVPLTQDVIVMSIGMLLDEALEEPNLLENFDDEDEGFEEDWDYDEDDYED